MLQLHLPPHTISLQSCSSEACACCRHTQVWSPAKNLPSAHGGFAPLFSHRSLPFYSLQDQQFSSQEAFLTYPGKGCSPEWQTRTSSKWYGHFLSLSVLFPPGLYSTTSSTQPTKESQINQVYCQVTPPTLPLSPRGLFWHAEVSWSPWGAPALAMLILNYQSQSRCWYS